MTNIIRILLFLRPMVSAIVELRPGRSHGLCRMINKIVMTILVEPPILQM